MTMETLWSCPARGTWIEITNDFTNDLLTKLVVPRKGHVD